MRAKRWCQFIQRPSLAHLRPDGIVVWAAGVSHLEKSVWPQKGSVIHLFIYVVYWTNSMQRFWGRRRHVTSSDLRSLYAIIISQSWTVVFHFLNGADGGYVSSRCAVFLKWLSEGLWDTICVRNLKAFDLMRCPSFQKKLFIKCALREKHHLFSVSENVDLSCLSWFFIIISLFYILHAQVKAISKQHESHRYSDNTHNMITEHKCGEKMF